MQRQGYFNIAGERFQYELCGDVSTRMRVMLVRDSDGLRKELIFVPHSSALRDVCGFIRDRINIELTRARFEDMTN